MPADKLADLYFERPNAPEGMRNKPLGKLFYNAKRHSPLIYLEGFRFGVVIGVTRSGNPPYLQGDIMCRTGHYEDQTGEKQIKWQFCGYIITDNSADGNKTIYIAQLEVMPIVPAKNPSGMWLTVKPEENE